MPRGERPGSSLMNFAWLVVNRGHTGHQNCDGYIATGAAHDRAGAALQYAGRGWSVLPCRDKVPLVRGGVHAATRDRATIERWWHTWPQADVAIACGAPSGVVVIDIDSPQR